MRLKDRVAIITGGARGIGKKISQTFLKEGASVYIFDVNQEEGARTIDEFQSAYDNKVNFFKVDITDEKGVEKSVEKIIDEIGRASCRERV